MIGPRIAGFGALSLVLLLAGCSVQVTGTYSTLAFASGRTTGMEIFILRGPESRYFALVQCARGALGTPVLLEATVVADDLGLPAITDSRSGCPTGAFRGHVQPSGIKGSFNGGANIWLPRKDSAWQ